MKLFTFLLALVLTAAGLPAQLTLEPISLDLPGGKKLAAESGRLRVPENRARPDSRLIELAFIRLKSTSPKPGSPIVWLAGGPGNSGTGPAAHPQAVAGWNSLTSIADVILLDQRSTGKSTPLLVCRSKDPVPADIVFFDREKTLAGLRERLSACAAEWQSRGADLAGYNTVESAADLESLRIAIGAPRLNLVGFSYGTHLALAMIRRYPDSVDRAVLSEPKGPITLTNFRRRPKFSCGNFPHWPGKTFVESRGT